MKKNKFCVEEFKDWLSKQHDNFVSFNLDKFLESKQKKVQEDLTGFEVKPKVSRTKLSEKVKPINGESEDLINDLIEFGGIITTVNDKEFVLEVDSGTFTIPKFCVKIKK